MDPESTKCCTSVGNRKDVITIEIHVHEKKMRYKYLVVYPS